MKNLSQWSHEHLFLGTDQHVNERRTWIVIGLTATTMVLEITAGLLFGSMALLADGWHMASHAAALSITAFGYVFARRHSSDPKFSFGTGKIGELAAYSSALFLLFIALIMVHESVRRFISPVAISFDEAIVVAVLGLVVNIVSAMLLKERTNGHNHAAHSRDHNLRSAYIHVLADALTSVLAIIALSAGRFLGWIWLDPLMGIVGAGLIARWAYALMRDTGRILLDMEINNALSEQIRGLLESNPDNHISDLHVWRVGPGHFAAIVSLITHDPHPPAHYKKRLAHIKEISHVTLEINPVSRIES